MTRIDDHGKKSVRPDEFTRRSFFKTTGAGLALLAATNLGIGSFSKTANAQKDEYVQIEGQNVKVVKLTRSLEVLGRETQPYVRPETTDPNGAYQVEVVIPGEVGFLVTLNALREGGKRDNTVGVLFPKWKDSPTRPEDDKGMRGANITDFAELVKATGQELKRVQIILDVTRLEEDGKVAKYYQAYIVPIDSQGNRTTQRGPGKYLGYKASYCYFNDGSSQGGGEGFVLLTEPTIRGPVAMR